MYTIQDSILGECTQVTKALHNSTRIVYACDMMHVMCCVAAKSCALPPSSYQAPNSAGWDRSCAGAMIGATCQVACAANSTGTTYTARCTDTNAWTVISGACKGVCLVGLVVLAAASPRAVPGNNQLTLKCCTPAGQFVGYSLWQLAPLPGMRGRPVRCLAACNAPDV